MENTPKFDEYLAHHGVKGQKWGVRRTKEQLGYAVSKTKKKVSALIKKVEKKRKAKAKAKEAAKTAAQKAQDAKKAAIELQKAKEKAVKEFWNKPTYEMSDEELTARIYRAQKEIDYKRKVSELNPKTVSYGEKIAKQVLEQYVIPTAGEAMKKAVLNAVDKANKDAKPVEEKTAIKKELDLLKLKNDLQDQKNRAARLAKGDQKEPKQKKKSNDTSALEKAVESSSVSKTPVSETKDSAVSKIGRSFCDQMLTTAYDAGQLSAAVDAANQFRSK